MSLRIRRLEVWSGEVPDRSGAAAATLAALSRVEADLHFLFTRPHPSKPDAGMMFLSPIVGPQQERVARAAGLAPDRGTVMLCVEGDNRPGVGSQMMGWLAVAGINLRGLSISAVGDRFAAYLAFDSQESATLAQQVLADLV